MVNSMSRYCWHQETHQQDSLWSWVVCICATLSQMTYFGILHSFGVMFPVLMAEFQSTREKTAWVSSIALSLIFFAAPVAGRVSESFGCRPVMMVGALSCTVGLVATSFVQTIDVMFLTFSTLMGLGVCCCRTMCYLIVAKYFKKRRSFAAGMVSMGPAVGMFVWGPTTQALIDTIGWRNAYRVKAVACSLMILLALTFSSNVEEENTEKISERKDDNKQLEKSKEKVKLLDWSVWKIPQFCILVTSFAVMSLCRFIPNIHLVKYSEELSIPPEQASYFFMFIGISSAASRVIVGRIGDFKCVNVRYVNQVGIAIAGVATLLLPLARSYSFVALYAAVLGFAHGAFITTQIVILLSIVGPKQRAAAFGFGGMLSALALAGGAPLAGFIADRLGSYQFAFYVAGCTMLVGAGLQFLLLCFKTETDQNLETTVIKELSDETIQEPGHKPGKDYLAELYVHGLLNKDGGSGISLEAGHQRSTPAFIIRV